MTRQVSEPRSRIGCLHWGGRILGGLSVLVVLLLTGGYIYQRRTTKADFKQFPPPGQHIDVGTHSLHLYCQGEGSPTVVVDAGNGDFSLGWALVQPEVARITRICTYDRAGYGWSDPGPAPRTARQMAEELHALLENAGIASPYVVVGHSLGGYTVRMVAALYPEEVVGMVLVDAGHEDQLARLPADYLAVTQQQDRYLAVMGAMSRFGVLRLMGKSAGEQALPPHVRRLPDGTRDVYVTMLSHPSYFDASLGELQALETTCAQARELGNLGALPLVVLTAENSIDTETLQAIGWSSDFPIEQLQGLWLELQADLAGLSSKSTHLVVEDSGHAIHLNQPDAVIAAIEQVVAASRDAVP